MPDNPHKNGTRDDQVLALLNKLGEQLIRSEKERLALGVKLTTLEQQYKRQAEKFGQTEALSQRVEEALSQQTRMSRKLDQVTQDKVRINRKLERIEEAVVETREALQSRALVLLTEQGVADRSGAPQIPADAPQAVISTAKPRRTQLWQSWNSRPLSLQAAAVAALVLIAVFGGWAATRLPSDQDVDAIIASAPPPPSAAPADIAASTPAPAAVVTTAETAIPPALPPLPQPTAATTQLALAAAPPAVKTPATPAPVGDDTLAAQLNDIAPAAGNPMPENLSRAAAAVPAKNIAPAAYTQKDAHQEPDIETFINQQRDAAPLSARVRPDPTLPPVVREIEKKALNGIPEAQHDLAAIYTAGHGGVATDYKKAAFWFKEAAVGGVANARYNLGVLYQQGLGVDKNIDKAIGWYRAAAVMGHPEAEYNLGIAHIEGIGTTYDPQRAAHYFEQAAAGGVIEADYNLGLIHENGLLGSPDKKEALYWYKRAATHGSHEGQIALAQLEKNMNLSPAQADRIVSGLHGNEAQASATAPARIPLKAKTAAAPAKPDEPATADNTPPATDGPDADSSAEPAVPVSAATPPAPSQSTALIAQIQEQLMKRGLYPGPADGDSNPVTADAIRAYQSANNLGADGRPTQALLVHMLSGELKTPAPTANSGTASNNVGTLRPDDMAMPDQQSSSRD